MMVIIILFNNKDYNNRTPLQEKIVFPKGHRWKEMRFLKENCSFLKLWNGMSRGFQSGETCY